MEPYMILTFGTSKGRKHALRVPRVGNADSYSDTTVRDIMNIVKTNSPFDLEKVGKLTSVLKAEHYEISESEFDVL